MGVYTVNVPITPLTSGGGFTSGDEKIPGFPGKWTAAKASGAGTYTGSVHPDVGLIFEAFGLPGGWEDFYNVTAAGGNFSFTNQVSGHAASAYQQAAGGFDIRFDGSTWTSITLNSLSFTLTGTPAYKATPGSPTVIMAGMLPNLFFEELAIFPLSPEAPENPVFPTPPPYDPGATASSESGYGGHGGRGIEARRRYKTGGHPNMSCLFPKDSTYLTIAGLALPANFPIMQQVSKANTTAQWLKTCPGFYNAGGSAAAMEMRIYRQQTGYAPGKWFASAGLVLGELVWVGQTSYPDLIPWGGAPLEYVVELTGITSIPASSAFDMVIQGFDTQ